MIPKVDQDIMAFLRYLDEGEDFFRNVDGINKYNIDAIIELIQYKNMKKFGDPVFTKQEIRQALKNMDKFILSEKRHTTDF